MYKKTIDVKGSKSVEVLNSGNDKQRFTTVVTITASGQQLPLYIIFRGLKKVILIQLLSQTISKFIILKL